MSQTPLSSRKDELTVAQLARYDDLVTDALIDHVSLAEDFANQKFVVKGPC